MRRAAAFQLMAALWWHWTLVITRLTYSSFPCSGVLVSFDKSITCTILKRVFKGARAAEWVQDKWMTHLNERVDSAIEILEAVSCVACLAALPRTSQTTVSAPRLPTKLRTWACHPDRCSWNVNRCASYGKCTLTFMVWCQSNKIEKTEDGRKTIRL